MTESKVNSINCPNCGAVIQIDETKYNQILDQVKGEELDRRTAQIEKQFKERLQQATEMMEKQSLEKEYHIKAEAEKDAEMKLSEARMYYANLRTRKDSEIAKLEAKLEAFEQKQELAILSAEAEKDKVINDLKNEVCTLQETISNHEAIANSEMESVRARLQNEKTAALMEMKSEHEKESLELREELAKLSTECHARDEMIRSLKDFKSKLSVKLLGESLEQHCEQAYRRSLEPVLTNAVFKKDTSTGKKGDYIFRENDANGEEILSIMFEMKTEDDLTGTSPKKKNRDHLDKLDKDRKRSGCEYAVLVSTLEPDSEIYNAGIVCERDYEKMYVIRPQVFVDFIHLLRALAKDKASVKKALEIERQKNVDVTSFEDNLNAFKENIFDNVDRADRNCDDAIDMIDKCINSLEKLKDKLESVKTQNKRAKSKADKLTIKTLTEGNPTMAAMFGALADTDEAA